MCGCQSGFKNCDGTLEKGHRFITPSQNIQQAAEIGASQSHIGTIRAQQSLLDRKRSPVIPLRLLVVPLRDENGGKVVQCCSHFIMDGPKALFKHRKRATVDCLAFAVPSEAVEDCRERSRIGHRSWIGFS